MYGPKWPFLLRYGSHDTRRIDFSRVDGLSTGPPVLGRHMRVWGCPFEVRIYNPHEKKLDPWTLCGFFIGYAEMSKGY